MSVKNLLESLQSGALSVEDAKRALRMQGSATASEAVLPPASVVPAPTAPEVRTESPMRARPQVEHRPELEPIAIVGLSGRYPQAPDLARFWALLVAGRDAVTEIPATRWRVDDYLDPTLPREGKMYAKWLGRLDDIECFDPLFFAAEGYIRLWERARYISTHP